MCVGLHMSFFFTNFAADFVCLCVGMCLRSHILFID